jgi:hypothetical protein
LLLYFSELVGVHKENRESGDLNSALAELESKRFFDASMV